MSAQDNSKMALLFLGIAAGAYFLYRVFSKEDSVQEAAVNTVKAPIKVGEAAVKAVTKLVKGSPEAKAHMKKLASMRKHVGRKKGSKDHKGHRTKRGLHQDQKLVSEEKWEKEYQKKKSGSKILKDRIRISKKLYPDHHPGTLLNKEIDAVNKEMKKESAEHPELPKKTIKKIVRDHRKKSKKIILKKIVLSQAEGPTEEVERNKNREFESITSAQAFLLTIDKPEKGYNKFDVIIHYSDGSTKRARYDHGHNDGTLSEQVRI